MKVRTALGKALLLTNSKILCGGIQNRYTIETGINEGATLALDGRGITVEGSEGGYYIGPTVFVDVKPDIFCIRVCWAPVAGGEIAPPGPGWV